MRGLLLLLIVTLWFAVAIWISGRVARNVKGRSLKAASVALGVTVLVPLPVLDELIGIWQFRQLCKFGVKMTVDEQRIKGKFVRLVIAPSWAAVSNTAVPIKYSRYSYRDTETNEELASYSEFDVKGGVFIHTLGILEGDPPLLLGTPWCGPSGRGELPAMYGFTLVK
ncbi:MAG: hypothetical protein ACMG55_14020 [Microcoleus sp.]